MEERERPRDGGRREKEGEVREGSKRRSKGGRRERELRGERERNV